MCWALGEDNKGGPFLPLGTHTSAFCGQEQALGSENALLCCLAWSHRTSGLCIQVSTPGWGGGRWINSPTQPLLPAMNVRIINWAEFSEPKPRSTAQNLWGELGVEVSVDTPAQGMGRQPVTGASRILVSGTMET